MKESPLVIGHWSLVILPTMDSTTAIDLTRDAVLMALLLCAPVLMVGLIAGLLIGLAQALTQVQDQTVAFVPKLIAMVAALVLTMPWLLQRILEYSEALFTNIPRTISGG
jgi:flagellar biosynthesis protein FliQ